MQAYRLHAFEGPDALRLEELPSPRPGFGQVLVRIRAVSLNYRDLLVAQGVYNPRLRLPLIPLSDGAGEVIALGEGCTRFRVGDRVAANFMPAWIAGPIDDSAARSALGGEADGLLAEEVVLPEAGLVRLPSHLTFEEAATLPCAGLTAWNAMFVAAACKPGETVLVQGTGGVSIFALQFARMAGARVIATSKSDQKLQRLKDLGASAGINYQSNPNWDDEVRALTDGDGVDLVIEVGGAGTLARSIRSVKRGGFIAVIGILSGPGEINPLPILMRTVRLQGIFVGSRTMFEDMIRAVSVHGLRPVVDRVFAFGQAAEAMRHLASGTHFGKVVIRV